ncbi:MAG: PHP domain-containing protein, partial [Spirochaetia bacterium]
EIVEPEFRHLIDTTWALIAHEKLSSIDPALSLFGGGPETSRLHGGTLQDRIKRYSEVGRSIDPAHPENAATVAGL